MSSSALELFLQKEGFIDAEILGEGSSATVLVAYSKKEQKDVALKVIPKKIEEFKVENDILDKIDNARVIKKYRTITNKHQKHAIIVMEMMDHDLMDTIEACGALKDEFTRKIFYHICRAVLYCHSKNIAHLDIKPENILLDSTEEQIILSDFGTAYQFTRGESVSLPPVGTFFYCAPEITRKQLCYPYCADIWSLGILLHVLLTGTWPFAGATYDEACENAENGIIQIMESKLSHQAKDLISNMLIIDAEKRYSIVQVIEHPFFSSITRRTSELDHISDYSEAGKKALSISTSRAAFSVREGDNSNSPRTCQIDLDSIVSPRLVKLNQNPLALRLSKLSLSELSDNSKRLKTPRETGSLTPKISINIESNDNNTESIDINDTKESPKKPQSGISSLFKKVKDITMRIK